jgi:hypothetical protein
MRFSRTIMLHDLFRVTTQQGMCPIFRSPDQVSRLIIPTVFVGNPRGITQASGQYYRDHIFHNSFKFIITAIHRLHMIRWITGMIRIMGSTPVPSVQPNVFVSFTECWNSALDSPRSFPSNFITHNHNHPLKLTSSTVAANLIAQATNQRASRRLRITNWDTQVELRINLICRWRSVKLITFQEYDIITYQTRLHKPTIHKLRCLSSGL